MNIVKRVISLSWIVIIYSCSTKQESTSQLSPTVLSTDKKELQKVIDTYFVMSSLTLSSIKVVSDSQLFKSNLPFIELATSINEKYDFFNENPDSLVSYFNSHAKMSFGSDSAKQKIDDFIFSYRIVEILFHENDSDDSSDYSSKKIDSNIRKNLSAKKILALYTSQMSGSDSLSSTEGIALYLQLAYFIYSLPDDEARRRVIKEIL